MDPARAAWYAEQGLQTICPTKIAIEQFDARVVARLMYAIIAGGGKVGWNLARELHRQGPRGHAHRAATATAT